MAQRNEEIILAAHAQAHAFFESPAMRQLQAGRLWEMALHFERIGKEHPARVARAEARRLAHGLTEPPSRYAERLYEKALLVTLAERQAPSTPGGAEARTRARAAERQRAETAEAERRSPGGIILP
jgi:hypothetical protein